MNTTKNRLIQRLLLNKKAKSKKLNGFTLVELMVVIVIVGILTAVGLPQLQKSQDKAKEMTAQQELVNAAKDCSTELLFGDEPTLEADRPSASGDYPVKGTCGGGEDLSVAMGSADGSKTFDLTIDENFLPGKPAAGTPVGG